MARYFPDLLEAFGEIPADQLSEAMIVAYANERYPTRTGISKNLATFQPISAVLHEAAHAGLCKPRRFRRFPGRSEKVRAAPERVIVEFLQRSRKLDLVAIVLLLSTTAARCIDARRLEWDDIDLDHGRALLRHTKNGDDRMVFFGQALAEILRRLEGDGRSAPFPWKQTSAVNRALQEEFARLDLPYYSCHKLGRHAFAERFLREGHTIKELKEVGGWRSMQVVEERYGHLEDGYITDLKREQAQRFDHLLPSRSEYY